jgi:hypothetical protein
MINQPERPEQSVCLPLRETLRQRQHRTHKLVQPSEGKIDLRLDPRRLQDAEIPSSLRRMTQQDRLAHTRLAVEHQDTTTTRTGIAQKAINQDTLLLTPDHTTEATDASRTPSG